MNGNNMIVNNIPLNHTGVASGHYDTAVSHILDVSDGIVVVDDEDHHAHPKSEEKQTVFGRTYFLPSYSKREIQSNEDYFHSKRDDDGSSIHHHGSSILLLVPPELQQDHEKMICTKLTNMSITERTLGMNELHGITEDDPQDVGTTSTTNRGAGRRDENVPISEERIQQKLQEMHEAACSASSTNDGGSSEARAYKMALAIDNNNNQGRYVDHIKRLCLRTDHYNSQKAASRLVSFFSFKQRLFGNEKLAREIVLADLNNDDMKALYEGRVQVLQHKDQAGRKIIFLNSPEGGHVISTETWGRVIYYTTMIALQDEETQKKGIVMILYGIGQKLFLSNRPSKLAASWSLLPIRIAAVHLCYDNSTMDKFLKIISRSMEGHHLCRFRSHYGTYLECMYKLMTFGISRDVLPINAESGEINLTFHHQWLNTLRKTQGISDVNLSIIQEKSLIKSWEEESPVSTSFFSCTDNVIKKEKEMHVITLLDGLKNQRRVEESLPPQPLLPSSSSSISSGCSDSIGSTTMVHETRTISSYQNNTKIIIRVPGPNDLLMGRGRHAKDFGGYLHFRDLLERYSEVYDNESRRKCKKMILMTVLSELRDNHASRFLKFTPEGYFEECSQDESINRIAHAFRNIRYNKKVDQHKREKIATSKIRDVRFCSSCSTTTTFNKEQKKARERSEVTEAHIKSINRTDEEVVGVWSSFESC